MGLTLKEKAFAKEINNPENGLNISKCMRKVGYSEMTTRSGTKYSQLRKITRKIDFFSPEKIKQDISYTFKVAKKAKDITNMSRINEHRTKIAGMITDKSEINNRNPDKVIIAYGAKPVDNSVDSK